jgi:hypothetical protein
MIQVSKSKKPINHGRIKITEEKLASIEPRSDSPSSIQTKEKKTLYILPDMLDDGIFDRHDPTSPLVSHRLGAIRMNVNNVATPGHQTRLLADADISNRLGLMQETISNKYVDDTDNDFRNDMITDRRTESRALELEFKRNTFWKSCCDSVIDRRATVFFTQVAIGAIVVFFAMAKIWLAEPHRCSGDDPSVYIGLISVILGWFVPAPSMK